MFCPNCGTTHDEHSVFCIQCGSRLCAEPPQPAQQPVPSEAAVQPPYSPVPSGGPASVPVHPVIGEVRRLASSPLFLVAVIALTASAVLQVFSAALGGGMAEWMSELMAELDMDMPVMMASGLTASSVVGTLAGMIPQILVIIGLWITYASAADRRTPFMKSSGLSLVKGAVMAEMIVAMVILGLCVLAMILLMVLGAVGQSVEDISYTADEEMALGMVTVVAGILLVILGGVIAFLAVYYAKIIKSVKAAVNTLNTGVPSSKVSVFVAVMCFIGAAGNVFSVSLASLAAGVAQVLFGVLLIQYRDRMRGLELPPVPPPAAYASSSVHINNAPVYVNTASEQTPEEEA